MEWLDLPNRSCPPIFFSLSLSLTTWGTPSQLEFTLGTVAGIFADDTPGILVNGVRSLLLVPLARIRRWYFSNACWEGSFTLKKLKNDRLLFEGCSGILGESGESGERADDCLALRMLPAAWLSLGWLAVENEVEGPGETSIEGVEIEEKVGEMTGIAFGGEILAVTGPVLCLSCRFGIYVGTGSSWITSLKRDMAMTDSAAGHKV
jgi:hypothetical protein